MAAKSLYPAELRKPAVWMVAEVRPDYPTEWVPAHAGFYAFGRAPGARCPAWA